MFKINDIVKFELARGKENPRWDIGNDRGGDERYTEGRVTSISELEFEIVFKYAGKDNKAWRFKYSDAGQPGFPEVIQEALKVNDWVRFEYGTNKISIRWDFGSDNGSSNEYGRGKILTTGDTGFSVRYLTPNNGDPNVWNFSYNDLDKPGFPTIINKVEKQKDAVDALHKWLGK